MAKKSKKRRRRQDAVLRALERRVAQLEQRDPTAVTGRPPPRSDDVTPDDGRWALAELRRRVTPPGGVVIAGAIDLPDGAHVDWQGVADTTTLLDQRWEPSTDRLAALAHPVRIDLLRRVLLGARTTAALTDLEIVGTSRQLYQHLRPLLTAWWLRQAARGRYEVPDERVVPLLVVLAVTGGRYGSRVPPVE